MIKDYEHKGSGGMEYASKREDSTSHNALCLMGYQVVIWIVCDKTYLISARLG